MEIDRNGLEVLNREECLRLLRHATLGRVAITSGALPQVLPVNFRLFGDRIVFRTGLGTKLDAATSNNVVAFEVDGPAVLLVLEGANGTDLGGFLEISAAAVDSIAFD